MNRTTIKHDVGREISNQVDRGCGSRIESWVTNEMYKFLLQKQMLDNAITNELVNTFNQEEIKHVKSKIYQRS